MPNPPGASIAAPLEGRPPTDPLRQRLVELAWSVRLTGASDLAAGLTHELNQPLCAILNYAEAGLTMMAMNAAPPAVMTDVVEKIREQAQRAGEVMRRLREVVGRRPSGRTQCDLNALVIDTLELMHAAIERHGGHVSMELVDHVSPVLADGVAIQQLVASLLRGGLEAMGELNSADRRLTVSTAQSDGQVRVTVSDARRNVTAADCEQMFDPLANAGSGLNLALGRALVESLGGRMWGTPSPGGGATIAFMLPVAKEE